MNLTRLRSFMALEDAGGFRRAADRLALSQPALTRQIQVLEAEMGATLVRRGRGPVTLTEAGRFLAQHAGRLLADADFLRQEAQRLDGGRDRTLCVGVIQSLLEGVFPMALPGWRRDWPLVPLRVLGFRSAKIIAEVLDGRVQLGFIETQPADPRLVWKPLFDDPFVVVLPPGHALSRHHPGQPFSLDDLAGESFVLQPPGFRVREAVDIAFATIGVTPRVTAELEGISAILALVRSGLGPTILPGSSVAGISGLTSHALTGAAPRRSIGTVWHTARKPDIATTALLEAVANAARALSRI
jgi:DNA-binding transcriptional LysR family regulator